MSKKNLNEKGLLIQLDSLRFAFDVEALLLSHKHNFESGALQIGVFLHELIEQLKNKQLDERSLAFPDYHITSEVLSNNKKVRIFIREQLEELSVKDKKHSISFDELVTFIVANHEYVMWAKNAWLLVNPGITLEPTRVTNDMAVAIRAWLKNNFHVQEHDEVLLMHVISENGKERLKKINFPIPFPHWDKHYLLHALATTVQMIEKTNAKGLYSNSWMFNPDNFKIASDGRPYAAFTFLADDMLVGYRLNVTNAITPEDFNVQKAFAMRNERRRRFVEAKEFAVAVYATFYPTNLLLQRKAFLMKKA